MRPNLVRDMPVNQEAEQALLGAILGGTADDAARRLFGELWQERVRRILIEHADDPEIVELRPLGN